MKKVWGDVRKLLDCKQGQGESHDHFVNKIIDQKHLIPARLVTQWLNGVIKLNYRDPITEIQADPVLSDDEKTEAEWKFVETKYEEAFAVLLILNSNPSKYSSLVHNLEGQYGRDTNQYPLNITDAKDALHTHYWDKLPNKNNKDKSKKSDKKDKNASNTSFYS